MDKIELNNAEIKIFNFSNGIQYWGECTNGNIEGIGCLYQNGRKAYEGEFRNGKRHGYGIAYLTDKTKYEGDWENDIQHGIGIIYTKNGIIRLGEMKNGKLYGREVVYFPNGDRYEGKWENNFSKGILVTPNESIFGIKYNDELMILWPKKLNLDQELHGIAVELNFQNKTLNIYRNNLSHDLLKNEIEIVVNILIQTFSGLYPNHVMASAVYVESLLLTKFLAI